jgi:hypothetical protein
MIELKKSLTCVLQEADAGVRNSHPGIVPFEQRHPELVFQFSHATADSRLPDAQCACRTPKAQILADEKRLRDRNKVEDRGFCAPSGPRFVLGHGTTRTPDTRSQIARLRLSRYDGSRTQVSRSSEKSAITKVRVNATAWTCTRLPCPRQLVAVLNMSAASMAPAGLSFDQAIQIKAARKAAYPIASLTPANDASWNYVFQGRACGSEGVVRSASPTCVAYSVGCPCHTTLSRWSTQIQETTRLEIQMDGGRVWCKTQDILLYGH